jgi:hypothetical protein
MKNSSHQKRHTDQKKGWYVSYFPCHHDGMPDINNLKEEKLFLAHGFKDDSPSWQSRQFTSWQPEVAKWNTGRGQGKI